MSAVQIDPEDRVLTRDEVGNVLSSFGAADWQRAKQSAKYRSGGITGMTADDLLQEAMTKLLEGERGWPAHVSHLKVLDSVMHSIASNERKRIKNGPIDQAIEVDPLVIEGEPINPSSVPSVTRLTAEDLASGKEQLALVFDAVADDEEVGLLTMLWAEGVRGEEARNELGWDAKKYDAVRNRLTRRLEKLELNRSGK